MLLVHKPLIDSKNKIGTTALMCAAENGHLEICEMLLKAGADARIVDDKGVDAMKFAEKSGKAELIKLFSALKK